MLWIYSYKGDKFPDFFFSEHHATSKKGSTIKGKNCSLWERVLLEYTPFWEGMYNFDSIVLPASVYVFKHFWTVNDKELSTVNQAIIAVICDFINRAYCLIYSHQYNAILPVFMDLVHQHYVYNINQIKCYKVILMCICFWIAVSVYLYMFLG